MTSSETSTLRPEQAESFPVGRASGLYEMLASLVMLTAASDLVASGIVSACSLGAAAASRPDLVSLRADLLEKRYRPGAILRILNGQGGRSRRIFPVRDRIVHTALLLVLDPVLADACSQHTRGNDTVRALEALRSTAGKGSSDFDAFDLEQGGRQGGVVYLEFLRVVARGVGDDALLGLLKLFLKAPVIETQFAAGEDRFCSEAGSRRSAEGEGALVAPCVIG